MKYKFVIFDLDGTLLDTLSDIADSLNTALSEFGYREQSMEEVRRHVGNGSAHLVERSLPGGAENKDYEDVLKFYSAWYDAHCRIKTKPYSGVLETIEKLKSVGASCAIVSNKPQTAVTELAKAFFGTEISEAVGSSPKVRRKPAPDTVLKVMENLGARPEDTVYVGDSEVDVKTAIAAGVDCISVLWGFRDRDELRKSGAKTFVSNAEELEKQLGL